MTAKSVSRDSIGGKAAESGADRGRKETITHIYDVVVHLSTVPAGALGAGLREEQKERVKSVFLAQLTPREGRLAKTEAEGGQSGRERRTTDLVHVASSSPILTGLGPFPSATAASMSSWTWQRRSRKMYHAVRRDEC
jgi:hypothetical protein